MLFIDARKLGTLVDRTRKEFSDEDIAKITRAYHAWRGEKDAGAYEDVPGFCKSASLEEIGAHGHVLTPGRYVGAADIEEDDVPFVKRFAALRESLSEQFAELNRLSTAIRAKIAEVGVVVSGPSSAGSSCSRKWSNSYWTIRFRDESGHLRFIRRSSNSWNKHFH